MKLKVFLHCLTYFIFFQISTALAQTDSAKSKDFSFSIGSSFIHNLNYFGRTDSLKSNAIVPTAELLIKSKYYLTISPILVSTAGSRYSYAGTSLSAGYQEIADKWITDFNLTVPVYNPEISLPQSVIKGQTGFIATRLTKIVNITVGGEVRLSDNIDYGATAGLSKILIPFSDDNRKVMLNPGAYLFAGTQRFSTSYTKKRVGILDLPGVDEKKTKTVDQFKVLAYEFNCPVILVVNTFTLTVTPAYVRPQNLFQVAGQPEVSEKGENSFYISLGIKYEF